MDRNTLPLAHYQTVAHQPVDYQFVSDMAASVDLDNVSGYLLLVAAIVCSLPVIVVVMPYIRALLQNLWIASDGRIHSLVLRGLRMFALCCAYIIIAMFALPIYALHYVDKY